MDQKILVLLVQLGSPKSPRTGDVRDYLKKFLGDPRVVDTHPLLWWPILNCLVLPFRPRQSARLYSRIWDGREFPLTKWTNSFARKVGQYCSEQMEVRPCYLLSFPGFSQQLDYWLRHRKELGKVIVVPQFPQYSESTTASVFDQWSAALSQRTIIPHFELSHSYHRLKSFIDLSVAKIDRAIQKAKEGGQQVDGLVLSFHGLPLRQILQKGDPYYIHCQETFALIQDRVTSLPPKQIYCTFQGRFGRAPWLRPATEDFVRERVSRYNDRKLAIYAPSFVVDCLETIDELGHELQRTARQAGGDILRIDCLNDDEQWAMAYAEYLKALSKGEEEALCYHPPQLKGETLLGLEQAKADQHPLDSRAKSTIKVVFLSLFLDLMGFSIIFPLFPALAKYYLEQDGDSMLLQGFFQLIHNIQNLFSLPDSPHTTIVLFGAMMGSLYSLLQFAAAPFWGSISDRWGRRKTLLITSTGLATSYLLWIFSGPFELLLLARTLGGIMAGNISVATAAIADVTSPQNRAKGMAFVGVAFALGFILGPAFGGLLGAWDWSASYPESIAWGINPFSLPALFAFLLGLGSILLIAKKFRETRPPGRLTHSQERTANLRALWQGLPNSLVNRVNGAYFLFICAFAGMEFTLTFLAVERLGYSPQDNAIMFVFIGLILALVQGGFVRRKAHQVGEKFMACGGMLAVIPGLWIIAFAHSTLALYGGLLFLSVGSAMIVPCLTALVSLYSPEPIQGRALGIFRSLGALGRVVGPLLAGLLYWNGGGQRPYLWGGIFLLLPLMLIWKLPTPPGKSETVTGPPS